MAIINNVITTIKDVITITIAQITIIKTIKIDQIEKEIITMKRSKSFDNSKPLLYLVATPIGNLSEVSKRALEVFSLADIIAAEDTRNTYSLLSNFGIIL